MLKRSRVSTIPDVARLAQAVAGPGIDTRIWASLAFVSAVSVDPEHGIFADVTLVPSQHQDTARVASYYAEPGLGEMRPLRVDDEVLVVAPSGDPDEGLVVVARLFSASDLPPAGWNNDSATTVSDVPIQLIGPKVRIGAAPNSDQPGGNNEMADAQLLGTTYRSAQSTQHQAEETSLTAIIAAIEAMALALTGPPPAPPPSMVSDLVTILSTFCASLAPPAAPPAPSTAFPGLLAALTQFEAGANTFLSGSAEVGK